MIRFTMGLALVGVIACNGGESAFEVTVDVLNDYAFGEALKLRVTVEGCDEVVMSYRDTTQALASGANDVDIALFALTPSSLDPYAGSLDATFACSASSDSRSHTIEATVIPAEASLTLDEVGLSTFIGADEHHIAGCTSDGSIGLHRLTGAKDTTVWGVPCDADTRVLSVPYASMKLVWNPGEARWHYAGHSGDVLMPFVAEPGETVYPHLGVALREAAGVVFARGVTTNDSGDVVIDDWAVGPATDYPLASLVGRQHRTLDFLTDEAVFTSTAGAQVVAFDRALAANGLRLSLASGERVVMLTADGDLEVWSSSLENPLSTTPSVPNLVNRGAPWRWSYVTAGGETTFIRGPFVHRVAGAEVSNVQGTDMFWWGDHADGVAVSYGAFDQYFVLPAAALAGARFLPGTDDRLEAISMELGELGYRVSIGDGTVWVAQGDALYQVNRSRLAAITE